MLSIQNLSMSYDGTRPILDNLSIAVPDGSILGVAGLNGSGKSTLLKCLDQSLASYEGKILWNDRPMTSHLKRCTLELEVAKDTPIIYDYLTGKEYLRFMANLRRSHKGSASVNAERQDELIQKFGLSQAASVIIQKYSFGMKRKIYLLSKLLAAPQLLLADEPTNGLDTESLFALADYLLEAKQSSKLTAVISSHDLSFLCKISDNLLILSHSSRVLTPQKPFDLNNIETQYRSFSTEESQR